jgi:hypothetical protein
VDVVDLERITSAGSARVSAVRSTRRGRVPVLKDPVTYGYVLASLLAVVALRWLAPGWLQPFLG